MTDDEKTAEELVLPAMFHMLGCPAGRTEEFEVKAADGTLFLVRRCGDCGGQRVQEASRPEAA